MDPIRITIKPPSFISLNTIGSGIYEDAINTPRNRRKATSTTFLTQTNANIIMYEAEIKEKHEKLNQYIQVLDEKIHKIVQNNEAEILMAYKNHFARVKKQMQEFKEETLQQASSSMNHTQKIQCLQKQLTVFRQEALKLFQKLVQKDKINEELRLNLDELTNEKKYMNETVKALSRRNKLLQAQIAKMQVKQKINQFQNIAKIDINSFTSAGIRSYKHSYRQPRGKQRVTPSSVNISKVLTQTTNVQRNKTNGQMLQKQDDLIPVFAASQWDQFSKQLRIKLSFLQQQLVNDVIRIAQQIYSQLDKKNRRRIMFVGKEREIEQKPTRFTQRSKSNYTNDCYDEARSYKSISKNKEDLNRKSFSFSKNQQMTEFFKKCVETVKKEIARRKNINSANFFKEGTPITLEQFMKIDFFRLVELIFANQKIIQVLYNALLDQN